MENFEWRYEQRQWDWDNPFLPVKAHLRLSVWGGCPGCNCGDPASGGLVLSFQADQIIPSWTAWGPEVTFPIGRKALQGGTKPLVSQESMSLNITSFYCGGKIDHQGFEENRMVSITLYENLVRKCSRRITFQCKGLIGQGGLKRSCPSSISAWELRKIRLGKCLAHRKFSTDVGFFLPFSELRSFIQKLPITHDVHCCYLNQISFENNSIKMGRNFRLSSFDWL